MSEHERREHLFLVVDHLLDSHREWVESDTSFFTEAYEDAANELVEVFGAGGIPADCRELHARAEAFKQAWNAFRARVDAQGAESARLPGQDFWRAVDSLEDARQAIARPRRRRLESIEDLTRQKVSDRQICIIYGWVLPGGAPDFDRLAEERESPGKHTGDGFVDPVERRQIDEAQRQQESLARLRRERDRKLERLTREAPESLEELVNQGVSARQIAGMLKRTVEEVYQECDDRGLPRPQEAYADVRTERGVHAPELNESQERIAEAVGGRSRVAEMYLETVGGERDEPEYEDFEDAPPEPALTLEQQIIELHQQGEAKAAIAARVGVGERKVSAVLRRFEKEPQAFGR